jgi:hypothetical protein
MGERVEKKSDVESRVGAYKVSSDRTSQSGSIQFRDNRPETKAQKNLQDQIAQSSFTKAAAQFRAMTAPPKREANVSDNGLVQRAMSAIDDTRTASIYKRIYWGKKKDFQGGADAGPKGVTGVTSYKGDAYINPKAGSMRGQYTDSVVVDADTHEYHKGHMLAHALGGGSDAANVFSQDGGQNTTGKWPSFERNAELEAGSGDENALMQYEVTLCGHGGTLKYDQKL